MTALSNSSRCPDTCRSCGCGSPLDTFILIELATGENCDESHLRAVLAYRAGGRVSVLEVRARLRTLSRRGLVLLEGRNRTALQRIERFSITRAGRAYLASHARALDLLAEEIHVALLSRR